MYDQKILNQIFEKIDWDITTPNKENVLLALKTKDVKVVILGQDPYPTKDVANGYAFAVNKGCKLPMSLRNIFKEINEVLGKVHTDETLQSWVNQGVLLLNTSLTTEIGKPNAHKSLWKDFTKDLILNLSKDKNIIWVLWGNEAKKFKKYLTESKVIEDAHPSPLSNRHRNKNTFKILSQLTKIKW